MSYADEKSMKSRRENISDDTNTYLKKVAKNHQFFNSNKTYSFNAVKDSLMRDILLEELNTNHYHVFKYLGI